LDLRYTRVSRQDVIKLMASGVSVASDWFP